MASFQLDEQVTCCDLCSSQLLATIDPETCILECKACGYRFVSPRPSQTEIKASYSGADFYENWIQDEAGRARMWSKRLALLLPAGSSVRLLDIGAGIGTFVAMARDRLGWKVAGTEVSSSAITIARERYDLDLLEGQVEELHLAPASFDMVTLWHVLEHVPSPAKTLAICHRLLAPRGWLAIAVPNDDEARSWLVQAKASLTRSSKPARYHKLEPGEEVHLSHFSGRVLTRALVERGFSIERTTVDDQYASPTARSEAIVRAYRVIRTLTGLNFGQATFVLARKKT